MTTEQNPIIEEIRRTRENLLATHHGDLGLLVAELQNLAAERARTTQPVGARPNMREPVGTKKLG